LRLPGTYDTSIHAINSIPARMWADNELSAKWEDALL